MLEPNRLDVIPTLLTSLTASILALLFEHWFLVPLGSYARNNKAKVILFLTMAVTLFIPLLVLRWFAVWLTLKLHQLFLLIEFERMNIYSNFFAAFSLFWGIIWALWVFPRLSKRTNRSDNNHLEGGNNA